jgi:hypothetical protein
MAHTSPRVKPTESDLVFLRFAVPLKMTKTVQSEVFVMTCADGVIRIPTTLLKERTHNQCVFEARLPRDVAAAFRSVYGEVFRLTRSARSPTTKTT